MNIIRTLLFIILLSPLTAVADGPRFEEAGYLFRSTNIMPVEDVMVDCAFALPYLTMGVAGGATADLYSLETEASQGRITDWEREKIGEFLSCWDMGQIVMEANIPLIEFGILYQMTVDGEDYIAGGTARLRTSFTDFLEGGATEEHPGMYMAVVGATVFNLDDAGELKDIVGTLSANILSNDPGFEGYYDGGLVTLRLFDLRSNDELRSVLESIGWID